MGASHSIMSSVGEASSRIAGHGRADRGALPANTKCSRPRKPKRTCWDGGTTEIGGGGCGLDKNINRKVPRSRRRDTLQRAGDFEGWAHTGDPHGRTLTENFGPF